MLGVGVAPLCQPRLGALFLSPEVRTIAQAHMGVYADILRLVGNTSGACELIKAAGMLQDDSAAMDAALRLEEAAFNHMPPQLPSLVSATLAPPSMTIACDASALEGGRLESEWERGGERVAQRVLE